MSELSKFQILKGEACGNVVEVLKAGTGDLSCCGIEMTAVKENTVDASKEKHVPVVEKVDGGYLVKVGSVAHPMEEKHYIEWIELVTATEWHRKELKPGEAAEALFKTDEEVLFVREMCNLHGLWRV